MVAVNVRVTDAPRAALALPRASYNLPRPLAGNLVPSRQNLALKAPSVSRRLHMAVGRMSFMIR